MRRTPGGAPYDRGNLWPEPRYPADGWDADRKDELEARLAQLVRGGNLSLAEAQRVIARDWTAAYRCDVSSSEFHETQGFEPVPQRQAGPVENGQTKT